MFEPAADRFIGAGRLPADVPNQSTVPEAQICKVHTAAPLLEQGKKREKHGMKHCIFIATNFGERHDIRFLQATD